MSKLKLISIMLFILMGSTISWAQEDSKTDKEAQKEAKKAERKAVKQKKLDEGRFMIFPVAAPGYTPELGGLIAVGGLPSFKTNRKDTVIQRSSMPFTIGYTTTGAIVANAILTSFWFEDKMRINADFWYKDMPDHYWGLGYDNGFNVPKSDTTTAYNREWWWINPRFLYQFRPYYFVGLNVDYNYTSGSNASTGVSNDANYSTYNSRPLNGGLGLILRYDSRDVPVDAREGLYADLRGTFYSNSFGSDNDYQMYLIDLRYFKTVGRAGRVMAIQAKSRITSGEVPYGEMSQIGTPFDLRGYQWGRYRDNHLIFFMAEYRHAFYNHKGEKSKSSVVTWMGSGSVFNDDILARNDLSWLPNFGFGYRFEVQPRMNLRLDFGIGRESSGFYFNFNQAF